MNCHYCFTMFTIVLNCCYYYFSHSVIIIILSILIIQIVVCCYFFYYHLLLLFLLFHYCSLGYYSASFVDSREIVQRRIRCTIVPRWECPLMGVLWIYYLRSNLARERERESLIAAVKETVVPIELKMNLVDCAACESRWHCWGCFLEGEGGDGDTWESWRTCRESMGGKLELISVRETEGLIVSYQLKRISRWVEWIAARLIDLPSGANIVNKMTLLRQREIFGQGNGIFTVNKFVLCLKKRKEKKKGTR